MNGGEEPKSYFFRCIRPGDRPTAGKGEIITRLPSTSIERKEKGGGCLFYQPFLSPFPLPNHMLPKILLLSLEYPKTDSPK